MRPALIPHFFALGKGCREIKLTRASSNSSSLNVGVTRHYYCHHGFSRKQDENNTITCINEVGVLRWEGYLDDCDINYCLPNDVRIFNAILINSTSGISPIALSPNETTNNQFFHLATQTFECDSGYSFRDSLFIVLQCNLTGIQVGRGVWEPNNVGCKRILIFSFNDH